MVVHDADGFTGLVKAGVSGACDAAPGEAPAPKAVAAEVRQLMEAMGLSEAAAAAKLRAAEGDVNRAIDECLAELC